MRTTNGEILKFLLTVGGLKRLPRTGWVMAGVPKPESVADHSFRTALITMLLCDELSRRGETVDRERAIKMALLHDIGEALTSDIPTRASRFVDKNEGAAVRDVLEGSGLDGYVEVWMDYNAGKSTEGKVVKFADRLEMLVLRTSWRNWLKCTGRWLDVLKAQGEAEGIREERGGRG